MEVFIRTIQIASIYGIFYLATTKNITFETLFDAIPAISIVLASVYFIWSIGKTILEQKELNFYLWSNFILILITTIIFSRFNYYRLAYNISTSVLISVAYASIYIGLVMQMYHLALKRVFVLFVFVVFVVSAYLYAQTYLRDKYTINENMKEIYIEAGAIIEREKSLWLIQQIKDCDKIVKVFKKRVEFDKSLKNDSLMKAIIEKYSKDKTKHNAPTK